MTDVADVLRTKGSQVYTIEEDASVYEAIQKMVKHDVGSLVVVNDDVPVGILTERHYLRRVALEGRTSKTTRAFEIMSPEIVCVSPETGIAECMNLMTEHRVRQLAVMSNGRLSGIVSIGDIVKRLAREHRQEIQYLTDYIQGNTIAEVTWTTVVP
jgi:CBS domain-containing protein